MKATLIATTLLAVLLLLPTAMEAQHTPDPMSTVTLRFQLIEADGFTTVDPQIADVEAVLRRLFRFRGYRLLNDAVLSNVVPLNSSSSERDSWADYQVRQSLNVGGNEYTIFVDVRWVWTTESGARSVDLAVLLFRDGPAGTAMLLETSVRIPDEQTVVLGNAQGTQTENAIILTVRPEVNTPR